MTPAKTSDTAEAPDCASPRSRFWGLPTDIVFGIMSVGVVPAIALIVGADVLARYVFSSPIFWAQDITTLLLLLLFFCGQPACLRHGDHVRMELLYKHMPDWAKRAVDTLSAVMAVFIAATITLRLLREATDPFSSADTHGFLKVPVLPVRILLMIVLALVIIEAMRRMIAVWRA